jgi:hypothetical protein
MSDNVACLFVVKYSELLLTTTCTHHRGQKTMVHPARDNERVIYINKTSIWARYNNQQMVDDQESGVDLGGGWWRWEKLSITWRECWHDIGSISLYDKAYFSYDVGIGIEGGLAEKWWHYNWLISCLLVMEVFFWLNRGPVWMPFVDKNTRTGVNITHLTASNNHQIIRDAIDWVICI